MREGLRESLWINWTIILEMEQHGTTDVIEIIREIQRENVHTNEADFP
jgi:hypothetical protein